MSAGSGIPRFADLAAGGRALVPSLQGYARRSDVTVLAVVPNGVPAALEVARALDAPVLGLPVDRPPDGDPVVHVPPAWQGGPCCSWTTVSRPARRPGSPRRQSARRGRPPRARGSGLPP